MLSGFSRSIKSVLAAVDALLYKGTIDCSGNPNYPAANAGYIYVVSVAGKIGGASGTTVVAGDLAICNTDGTAAGTQAAVGSYWNIIEKNIDLTNIIISGGTINNTIIGGTTPQAGTFTTAKADHIGETTGSHGVVFDNAVIFSKVAKTAQGSNIASASTTDLSTATGNYVHITGTTTITAFGTVTAGTVFALVFDDVLTVTHNGTSLICPGAKNIRTTAGARMFIVSEGSGNWRVLNYLDGTSSVFARATPIIHGATEAANAYDLYGKTHLVTGNYTVTLPAVAVGMHGRFYATTGAAFSVDCNGSDHFVLGGTALTAGNKVTSDGSAGAMFEWECTAANTITILFSNVTFIDGGA